LATVCNILNDLGFRVEDLERRLASIRLYSASQEGINFHGATWEVSGNQIAVWSAATNLPLSWSQGQWARLKAGKIEARGDAFTFKSSDTGARIELDGTELAGYDSGGTKQFYLSAADGKGYFAGGDAVLGTDGIILSSELIVTRDTTETANQTDRVMYLSVLADPASTSLTTFLALRARADVVTGCTQDIANLTGGTFAARHYGTGAVTNMEGGYAIASLYTSGGSTPFACGWSGSLYAASGTTITKGYNLWARTQAASAGTITTGYGLFVDAVYGTTKYGIWQDGTNDLNVLKGDLELKGHLFDHTGLANGKRWQYNSASGNWELVDESAPGVHTLVSATHTASGLTIGHIIRATGASSFAWQQLQWGDIGGTDPLVVSEVRAASSAGLKLYNDAGVAGVLVKDDGSVGVGGSPDTLFNVTKDGLPYIRFECHDDTNYYRAMLESYKSRGTRASPTVVVNDDWLGSFDWLGYDGDEYLAAVSMVVIVDGAAGNNDMPGRLEFRIREDGAGGSQHVRLVVKDEGIDVAGSVEGEEIRLVPKASSSGAEGTLFYCSTDDYVYVATEA